MATKQAPIPDLAHAFDMVVDYGAPVEVGRLAIGGTRIYLPVSSGSFIGEGLVGTLVGGGETLFRRANGVTVLEAVYYIQNQDGWVARSFGNGYQTSDGDFIGTRMTLLFEADENGPLAHLATSAFVAEQLPGSYTIAISRII